MALILPPALEKLMSMFGPFPEMNETMLRGAGDEYEKISGYFGELSDAFGQLIVDIRENFQGQAADAFIATMHDFVDGADYLGSARDGALQLAQFARDTADEVEYAKWMSLAMLIQLLAELAFYAATSWFNPAAEEEAAAAETVTGIVIRGVLTKLLKAIVTHVVLSAGMGVAMDVLIQLIQKLQGHRTSWSKSTTIQTLETGVTGAVVGLGLGPLGEKLSSLIGDLFGRDLGKSLANEFGNLFSEPFAALGQDGARGLGNDLGHVFGENADSLVAGFGKGVRPAGVREIGGDTELERAADIATLTQSMINFGKDVAAAFEQNLGEKLGADVARGIGGDFGASLAGTWGRRGANLTQVKEALAASLAPHAELLGADAVKALAEQLPDAVVRALAERGGPDVGRMAAQLITASAESGVNMTLTQGLYSLIFDPSHTFAVSGENFGMGAAMGAVGRGGHLAVDAVTALRTPRIAVPDGDPALLADLEKPPATASATEPVPTPAAAEPKPATTPEPTTAPEPTPEPTPVATVSKPVVASEVVAEPEHVVATTGGHDTEPVSEPVLTTGGARGTEPADTLTDTPRPSTASAATDAGTDTTETATPHDDAPAVATTSTSTSDHGTDSATKTAAPGNTDGATRAARTTPDTSRPDTSHPDTSRPDTSRPDTNHPGATGGAAPRAPKRADGGQPSQPTPPAAPHHAGAAPADAARAARGNLSRQMASRPPDRFGHDPFGVRQAPAAPAFIRTGGGAYDYTRLHAAQRKAFFQRLDMRRDTAPTAADMTPTAAWEDNRSVTSGTYVGRSSGSGFASGFKSQKIPHLVHSMWFGGPLHNDGSHRQQFMERIAAGASENRGFDFVVWTDVPRAEFRAIEDGTSSLPLERQEQIRQMLDWARRSPNIRLVNIDEVFNRDNPMELQAEVGTERARGVGLHYAMASDMARVDILNRFGGVYSDGDNPVGALGDLVRTVAQRGDGFAIARAGGGAIQNSSMISAAHGRGIGVYIDELRGNYGMTHDQLHELSRPDEITGRRVTDQDAARAAVNADNSANVSRTEVIRRTGPSAVTFARIAERLGYRSHNELGTVPTEVIGHGAASSWMPPRPAGGQQAGEYTGPAHVDAGVVQSAVRSAIVNLHTERFHRRGGIYLPAADRVIRQLPPAYRGEAWHAVLDLFHDSLGTDAGSVPWVSGDRVDPPRDVWQRLRTLFPDARRIKDIELGADRGITRTAKTRADTPPTVEGAAPPRPATLTGSRRPGASAGGAHVDDPAWNAARAAVTPVRRSHSWVDPVSKAGGAHGDPTQYVVHSAFDARRFEIGGGRVSDLTVKVRFERPAIVPDERLDAMWQRALRGVEEHLNGPRYKLPNGDRLHVTIERTDDPAQAHLTVNPIDGGGAMTQRDWHVNAEPVDFAHEISHQIGLRDEYRDETAEHRPDVAGSLAGDYHRRLTANDLPKEWRRELPAQPLVHQGLRSRHLQLIDRVIGDVPLNHRTEDAPLHRTVSDEIKRVLNGDRGVPPRAPRQRAGITREDAGDEHAEAVDAYTRAAVDQLRMDIRRLTGEGTSADAAEAARAADRLRRAEERLDDAGRRLAEFGDETGPHEPLPEALAALEPHALDDVLARALDLLGPGRTVIGHEPEDVAAREAQRDAVIQVAERLARGDREEAEALAADMVAPAGFHDAGLAGGALHIDGRDLTAELRAADPAQRARVLAGMIRQFRADVAAEAQDQGVRARLTPDELAALQAKWPRIERKLRKIIVDPAGGRGNHPLIGRDVGTHPLFGSKRHEVRVNNNSELARGLAGWVDAKPNRHEEGRQARAVEEDPHISALLNVVLRRLKAKVETLAEHDQIRHELTTATAGQGKFSMYLSYFDETVNTGLAARNLARLRTPVWDDPDRIYGVLEHPETFEFRDKVMVLHDLMAYFIANRHTAPTAGSGKVDELTSSEMQSTIQVDADGMRVASNTDRGQNRVGPPGARREHPSTRNERAPSTVLARENDIPVWSGQSNTAGRMFKVAKWAGASRLEIGAVAWSVFAFWRLHYDHTSLAPHTLHEVLDIAQNFGVPYSIHDRYATLGHIDAGHVWSALETVIDDVDRYRAPTLAEMPARSRTLTALRRLQDELAAADEATVMRGDLMYRIITRMELAASDLGIAAPVLDVAPLPDPPGSVGSGDEQEEG